MISLFFSYSHTDEDLRNELEKHLSILIRQGVLSTWHDRRITAGSELDAKISNHLKSADIILLLISADFLASDYCYEKEMQLAMQRHQTGEAVVIPVILRPCDWHQAPFGKLMATPKDGKPVTKHQTLDDAFLDITTEIRKVAQTRFTQNPSITVAQPATGNKPPSLPRSSNLSIRKSFSDQEKDQFLDAAFEYIANYFEGSLAELERRNPEVNYRFKRLDSQTITANLYTGGQGRSECMIFQGSFMGRSQGISYSAAISQARNSFNESLVLGEDGNMLYLKSMGMFSTSRKQDKLTFEGAAELFWEKFIEPLQRGY